MNQLDCGENGLCAQVKPLSPGTVIVTCGRSEHFMTVDPTTARNLEIAAPLGGVKVQIEPGSNPV